MSLQVLLVDDDDLYWELVSHVFTASSRLAGVDIQRCADGVEFVERVERGDDVPPVVLLDQNMPKMDGTDTLRTLRERELGASVSICLMTSSEQPQLVREALEAGARFCFNKPTSFRELEQTFERIVDFFLNTARLPS